MPGWENGFRSGFEKTRGEIFTGAEVSLHGEKSRSGVDFQFPENTLKIIRYIPIE
jgi:hypothetical protein